MVVVRDDENKKCYLSLRGYEIVNKHIEEEDKYLALSPEERKKVEKPCGSFRPEYGRHMVEATPFEPYKGCLECMLETEFNMQLRYENQNTI